MSQPAGILRRAVLLAGQPAGRAYLQSMEHTQDTRVLYNDQCPVCRFEIRHYDAYARRSGLPLRFEDLNASELEQWGLSADMAARRLHVLKDGELHAGIPAFLILWSEMPRYRWLGRFIGLPGVRQAAIWAYDRVLAPVIYRWHLRRIRVTRRSGP